MTFDSFLRRCAEDCANGSSGEVVAAELRSRDWRDVNERGREQDYSLRLGYRKCRSCGREHLKEHLEDGWCPQCNASSAEELALAVKEAPQRFRKVAADWRERGLVTQADLLDAHADALEKGK